MKAKQTTLALGIAAAAGMAVVCLKDENRRQQMKNKLQAMLAKWKGQKTMANENVFKLGILSHRQQTAKWSMKVPCIALSATTKNTKKAFKCTSAPT